MAVFIDDMKAPYRGMKMNHMIADTHNELVEMAVNIGVQVKWIQKPGTPYEHFDICESKKKLAVDKFGANAVSQRDVALIIRAKRFANEKKFL